jgi:hypothetical protein
MRPSAHVFNGGGAQAPSWQLGEEAPCRHLEVAAGVPRGKGRQPTLEDLLIVLGPRCPAQGGHLDGRQASIVAGHGTL